MPRFRITDGVNAGKFRVQSGSFGKSDNETGAKKTSVTTEAEAKKAGIIPSGITAQGSDVIVTPQMTSNTAPSGVASAKGVFDTYAAWRAFNRTNVDYTDSWLYDAAPTLGSSASWAWLKYDFGSGLSKTVTQYNVISRNYSDATHPKTWVIQGSDDNTAWTDLHSVSNETWSPNQTKSYVCTTVGTFRYFRMLIKESTGPTYISVGELQLRGPAA